MSKIYLFCIAFLMFGFTTQTHAQISSQTPSLETPPWQDSQLLAPAVLAEQLKADAFHVIILNMGPMEDIRDATHIGPGKDAANIEKLKKEVASLPKNTQLIIYCGCCPLASKCPNVKPAFNELTKLGFTNIKVLDLVTNLKTNWINEGYPLAVK